MYLEQSLQKKYAKTKEHTSLRGVQKKLIELTGVKQPHMAAFLVGKREVNITRYGIIKEYLEAVKIPKVKKDI